MSLFLDLPSSFSYSQTSLQNVFKKYTRLHRTDWDPGVFFFSKAKSLKFESHILLIQTFSTTTSNNSNFKSQQPATTEEVTLKQGR